jgi:RNA polymerase sigma-70 factor, ECF subfamily
LTEQQQRETFEKWLKRYPALLFKVVRAYASTAMDQDDLFQEIIIQVWNSVPAFREESSVTTWLYRISLNTAIKWTTKERRHHERNERIDDIAHILQESSTKPDERLDWLYQEITQMTEIDRSIALLLLEGFNYKEMAGITGITESNIGVRINRIKKHLVERSKKI